MMQIVEKAWGVRGKKVTHHKEGTCEVCKERKEVATIWFYTREDDWDFNYSEICKECASKTGHEVVY